MSRRAKTVAVSHARHRGPLLACPACLRSSHALTFEARWRALRER
jgi:hypothetical protein